MVACFTLSQISRGGEPAASLALYRVAVTGTQSPAAPVASPIPGARSTGLAAARAGSKGGLTFLTQAEFEALGLAWPAFQAQTAQAASAQLARLTPEWVRDRNQVIECAILRAAQPGEDITPVILAPDFLKRFTPVFGRKILIAIPDRRTIFLFPRLASRYQDYAERVLTVYKQAAAPVSREVLELSATGLRAVGEYEE